MMKYIAEYRDKKIVNELLEMIRKISSREVSFMEVCGGHTMAIQKFGIPSLLPSNITLKSGPGCPVCVSSRGFIDHAVELADGQTIDGIIGQRNAGQVVNRLS